MIENKHQKVIFDRFGEDCGNIIYQYKLDLENVKYKHVIDYINSNKIKYKKIKELVNIKDFHNYCIENNQKFSSLINVNYYVENWFGKKKLVAYNKQYNQTHNIHKCDNKCGNTIINGPFSRFDNCYHNKFKITAVDSRSRLYGFFSNHYIVINTCYKESLLETLKKIKERFTS